ncbi:MD-2-related lipid-recognition domain-containing protein [Globomyces pollinis-pini]|nr:MD-2-related lipid-recognition domain-containing protein [Globomyces pollinis-pini]
MKFSTAVFLASAAFAQNLKACEGVETLFKPSTILVSPWPVIAGGKASITAEGVSSAVIGEGTEVDIVLTTHNIPIFRNSADFCEAAAAKGHPCPRPAGQQTIEAEIVVPAIAPAGTFQMEIRTVDVDGNDVACFAGDVLIAKP